MANRDVNITTRQLAEIIPVDPSTIRRWVESGDLTPSVVTPGGHYRFNEDAALAQISQIGAARRSHESAAAGAA